VDPINNASSTYYTYTPGGSWELTAIPESQKVRTNSQQVNQITGAIVTGSDLNLSPLFSSNGLVGYWKFDEGQGTSTQDSSGNGNTGTWNGTTPYYATGKVGVWSGNFGNNVRISVASSSSIDNITNNITISAWIYIKSWTASYSDNVFSKSNGTADAKFVYYLGGTYLPQKLIVLATCGGIWRSASPSSQVLPLNAWLFVVWAYNNGGYLYINGVSQGSPICSGSLGAASGSQFTISSPGDVVKQIDDVRIYNRALSAAEIMALYNATK
ncbi:MAG TPA: LamG domain-containing protein, partial [Candidatus Paceibacterota bacterium]|nr:LamG domain-containing protein [Candidatus Paceibacterota bacterium]